MDSNTHSTQQPPGQDDDLAALTAAVDRLATRRRHGLPDTVRAERLRRLRGLADRIEGYWLQDLADLDACGAAGAEEGLQAVSTAGWLRSRLRMGAGAAHRAVRTARAVFRGPLAATGAALTAGELSPAHAAVLADGTRDLPAPVVAEAEPVLLEAARHLDPRRLRQAVGHLRLVADPDREADRAEQRHARRGLWISPTFEGMVALQGQLDPEAGQTVLAALEPLARPASADDTRSASQRNADALTELARRNLEAGRLPQTGGVRPQLSVVVDLDSLLGRPGAVGGEAGWAGPLDPEACRRLACDGAITRVVVTRQPDQRQARPDGPEGLTGLLRAAMALLPPTLGGAATQPLDVGRASRVVQPAQRTALAVRDGGCVFPGCERPLAWCEAHHLIHWLHGGPTDLTNLALLCRAHHRAVHEGGWRLVRGPDGRFTGTPPHRRHGQRTRHTAA